MKKLAILTTVVLLAIGCKSRETSSSKAVRFGAPENSSLFWIVGTDPEKYLCKARCGSTLNNEISDSAAAKKACLGDKKTSAMDMEIATLDKAQERKINEQNERLVSNLSKGTVYVHKDKDEGLLNSIFQTSSITNSEVLDLALINKVKEMCRASSIAPGESTDTTNQIAVERTPQKKLVEALKEHCGKDFRDGIDWANCSVNIDLRNVDTRPKRDFWRKTFSDAYSPNAAFPGKDEIISIDVQIRPGKKLLISYNNTAKIIYSITVNAVSGAYLVTHPGESWSGTPPTLDNSGGSSCFPGDTLITLADYTTKPIQDIRPNDKILGFDTNAGNLVVTNVVQIRSPTLYEIFEVHLENGQMIQVSLNHPFYTSEGRWAAVNPAETMKEVNFSVEKLHSGLKLMVLDSSKQQLVPTQVSKVVGTGIFVPMYNIDQASPIPTFFANGALVHNKINLACYSPGQEF